MQHMLLKSNLANSLTAFFSVSYIPFILPILLEFYSINNDYLWFCNCILLAVATFIATFISKKPIIAGPSIAGIAIIASKIAPITNNPKIITTIVICTSTLLIISSLLGATNSLLQIISTRIKTGFRAGVGLMFIIIACSMVKLEYSHYFLSLSVIFFLCRKQAFVCPIICLAITVFMNQFQLEPETKFSAIYFLPVWQNNLIPSIISLTMTMLIDSTITGNTLNPKKENTSIKIAAGSSYLGAIACAIPCSIYLESLIFPKNAETNSAYMCAFMFLVISIAGSSIIIPSYLAAALLAVLGIKIIHSTKPKLWLTKSPQIILIMLVIAIFKSFLYGIFVGLLIEVATNMHEKNKITKNQWAWLLTMLASITLINT